MSSNDSISHVELKPHPAFHDIEKQNTIESNEPDKPVQKSLGSGVRSPSHAEYQPDSMR
jgi:hypothetical protein